MGWQDEPNWHSIWHSILSRTFSILKRARPDASIINLETSIARRDAYVAKGFGRGLPSLGPNWAMTSRRSKGGELVVGTAIQLGYGARSSTAEGGRSFANCVQRPTSLLGS